MCRPDQTSGHTILFSSVSISLSRTFLELAFLLVLAESPTPSLLDNFSQYNLDDEFPNLYVQRFVFLLVLPVHFKGATKSRRLIHIKDLQTRFLLFSFCYSDYRYSLRKVMLGNIYFVPGGCIIQLVPKGKINQLC